MPRTPKGAKRPADVISNAVTIMKIATGEVVEPPDTRDQAALALSKRGAAKGGNARAKNLTAAIRRAIAMKAARKRWGRDR